MPLIQASVQIRGNKPLLYHCFSVETLAPSKREKTGSAGYDPEEWKRTYTATADGQLYLDPTYIFACLRDGAKRIKVGRRSVQSDVAATLQVLDDKVMLNRQVPVDLSLVTQDREQSVYIDVRSVKNPGTGARNARFRLALAPGWEATFRLTWESSLVNRDTMHAVCNDAGLLAGIGDGRKMGFGRFEVLSFEAESAKTTSTA
jgi:hypothetical protein